VARVRPTRSRTGRCGRCPRRAPGYDQGQGRRRWRGLDLGTTRVYLEADAPRVDCPEHGVTVSAVPWARHGSRFTAAFEDTCAWLACHAALSVLSVLLRVTWRAVSAIVIRVVTEAAGKRDRLAGLRRIGVDEISYRRGQRYLLCGCWPGTTTRSSRTGWCVGCAQPLTAPQPCRRRVRSWNVGPARSARSLGAHRSHRRWRASSSANTSRPHSTNASRRSAPSRFLRWVDALQTGAEPGPSTPSPFTVSRDGRLDLTIGKDGAITLNVTRLRPSRWALTDYRTQAARPGATEATRGSRPRRTRSRGPVLPTCPTKATVDNKLIASGRHSGASSSRTTNVRSLGR